MELEHRSAPLFVELTHPEPLLCVSDNSSRSPHFFKMEASSIFLFFLSQASDSLVGQGVHLRPQESSLGPAGQLAGDPRLCMREKMHWNVGPPR